MGDRFRHPCDADCPAVSGSGAETGAGAEYLKATVGKATVEDGRSGDGKGSAPYRRFFTVAFSTLDFSAVALFYRRFSVRRIHACPACRSVVRCTAADRKSTRLNSSHLGISYAVFCLKKKK